MIPAITTNLSFRIVEIVSNHPGVRAEEIKAYFKDSYNQKVSDSTLYRHLAALVESQCLFRYRKKFFVHRLWVEELANRANELKENLSRHEKNINILPRRAGELRKYSASSMVLLDSIWNDVVLQISSEANGEPRWGYNAYPLHALAASDSERKVYKSVSDRNCEVFLLYGHQGTASEWALKEIATDKLHARISKVKAFNECGYIAWAHGPYVLECRLPAELSHQVQGKIRAIDEAPQEYRNSISELFGKRYNAACSFTVRKSNKRADALREVLLPYFA